MTSPPYAAPAAGPPRDLALIPPTQRIDETSGWIAGTLGVVGLLVALGMLIEMASAKRVADDSWKILGGAVAGMVVFGGFEVYRRLRRSALAFFPDRSIGIYNKGQLVGTVYANQISWFKLSIANTIREMFLFGFLALGGVAALSVFPMRGGFALFAIAGGLGGVSMLASSIYDRMLCLHYIVPGAGQIALPKSRLRAVASAHGLMGL